MLSAITPQATTAQISERITEALALFLVNIFTESKGLPKVEIGFIAILTTIGAPIETPASIPPQLLVLR